MSLLCFKNNKYYIFSCCGRCPIYPDDDEDGCSPDKYDCIEDPLLEKLVDTHVDYELVDGKAKVKIPPKLIHGWDTDKEYNAYLKGVDDGKNM